MSLYSSARIGLAMALAMMNHGSTSAISEGGFSQNQIGQMVIHGFRNHYKSVGEGKPSGAARAKRIARKRRNIRARSAK